MGRPARRWLGRVVRVIGAVYLGTAAVLVSFQTRLIFPGAATQGSPDARMTPPLGAELVRIPAAGGQTVVALFGPALQADGRPHPDAANRPTLLYFYGNAMCLRDALDAFGEFRRLGVNVLIPDYLGYGASSGSASEAGCVATAEAAFSHLQARPDVNPHRIVAGGWSLGAAVAVDLAARQPVAGLAAFSAFTSLDDLARRTFWFLPVSLLLRHHFANERKIARVTCPILIGHGRRDELIPFSMADRLAAAAGGPVTRITVEHAGHNDFFDSGGKPLLDAIRQFLDPR